MPGAMMIAQANRWIFDSIEAKVEQQMGKERGIALRRDDAGNLLIDLPRAQIGEDVDQAEEAVPQSVLIAPAPTSLDQWKMTFDLAIGRYFLLLAWAALFLALLAGAQARAAERRGERFRTAAKAAELRSLRYQVNPHFLFNTLNSISTLVLLKQSETANAMLTRLSSFLRHTLVTQPGGKVTVAQEMETLQLYLGIEQMRFEERLRSSFRIEPEAAKAELPAMLLQPLVENAIKYGVSPQEEGAEIDIVAQVVGPRLRVTVSDTGPGMTMNSVEDGLPAVRHTHARRDSTGVGLANIRDRLAQAYGEEHRFEIRSPESGGFSVLIELPYETKESPALSEAQAAPAQALSQKPSAPPAVVPSPLPPKAPQTT
ncbi:MAG TPA: sensor histidine kinase [Erythrobacter sp.]|nr:sensor histidine kinase [Erythrobacter sp.]